MASWLEEAAKIVEERENQRVHPLVTFLRIAIMWSVIFNTRVTPIQVCEAMKALKTARELEGHRDDNQRDTAGYVACVQAMDEWMKENYGYDGVKHFEKMTLADMWNVLREATQKG